MTPLRADGISFLIVLAVFIGSAIVERMRKKAAERESSPTGENRPSRRVSHQPGKRAPEPEPVRTAADWEKELQKLLGMEPPPEAPPKPPPVPERSAERASPPPLRSSTAPPPAPAPGSLARIEPKLAGAKRVSGIQLPELRESAAAHQHASTLQEQVAGRLKHVEERMQHSATAPPSAPVGKSGEVSRAAAMFRDPGAIRQAVIASIILAPPPGLPAD